MVSAGDVRAELVITLVLALSAGLLTYLLARRLSQHAGTARRDDVARQARRADLRRLPDAIFASLFLVYIVVFGWSAVSNHTAFNTGYDLSIFDQVVWNSLRGRLLENSIMTDAVSMLGHHFSPILLALVPLYAIWSDPLTLLILQTVAIASAALPIYWFARRWLGNPLALAVALAFFLFPSVENVNLYEFHEIALAIPLLSFATLFLIQKRYWPFLLCTGLCLLVKEEIAFVVAGFGVFLFFQSRRRLGVTLAAFGLAWGAFLLVFLIPFFNSTHRYIFARMLYSSLGSSPLEILASFVRQPGLVLATLTAPYKVEFVALLLAPLGLLPLIGAEAGALALPSLAYLLLSNKDLYSLVYLQYSAPLIPFLFFGMILGLRRSLRFLNARFTNAVPAPRPPGSTDVTMALTAFVLVSSLGCHYLYAPGPLIRRFNPDYDSAKIQHESVGSVLMARIPENASVITEGTIMPHLSERQEVWQVPWNQTDLGLIDYLFGDTTSFVHGYYGPQWDAILESGYFKVQYQQDGYFIARRISAQNKLDLQFGDRLSLLGYSIVSTDTVRGGQDLHTFFEWSLGDKPLPNDTVELELTDLRGNVWRSGNMPLVQDLAAANMWRRGKTVTEEYAVSLPSTMPPDEYQIGLGVYDLSADRYVTATQAGRPAGDLVQAGRLRVEKDKSNITATELRDRYELAQPFYVDMQQVRLIGYVPVDQAVPAGGVLPVGLYWRARVKPSGDYSVLVQLLDSASRAVYEESDRPAGGAYPTTQWDEGEVLLDWHDLTLPHSLSPGDYRVHVRLVDIATGAVLGETDVENVRVVPP